MAKPSKSGQAPTTGTKKVETVKPVPINDLGALEKEIQQNTDGRLLHHGNRIREIASALFEALKAERDANAKSQEKIKTGQGVIDGLIIDRDGAVEAYNDVMAKLEAIQGELGKIQMEKSEISEPLEAVAIQE